MEIEDNLLAPRIGLARTLAKKLLKDAGILEVPVSLWKVISYLKTIRNLTVMPYDFGQKIDGMLVMVDDEATIGYNNTQHWHRRRFTIAHEIGHLLIGHTCESSNPDFNDKRPSEIEANQFAAELLIPLQMLKSDFRSGVKNVKILTGKYCVSEVTMWIRIKESKLLNKM